MKVQRNEVLPYNEYEKIRNDFRNKILAIKEPRRIHCGEFFTFLFENHDTVLYQIQEMIRTEKISHEKDIQFEVDTYNELLGDKGELGCTLLIEIPDKEQRDLLLSEWKDLPQYIFLQTEDGTTIPAQFDKRQIGKDRLSSVQYLKFPLGDKVPSKVVIKHPKVEASASLSKAQQAALLKDLCES
ncbi:MAG: DUF3501 family protein [Bdellovibrio sp.]|nr:MAG: DUF3501 family protein [Bdellovibrio sp.]